MIFREKLDINIDKVRLADGEKVLLRAVKGVQGGGHQGAMVGAMVATSLVLWPAAPFFLLMHGKDITIPKGNQVTAFIQGDAVLDSAKFTPEGFNPKAATPVTENGRGLRFESARAYHFITMDLTTFSPPCF